MSLTTESEQETDLLVVGDDIMPGHGEHLCHLWHLFLHNESPQFLSVSLSLHLYVDTRLLPSLIKGKARAGIVLSDTVPFIDKLRVLRERVVCRQKTGTVVFVPK